MPKNNLIAGLDIGTTKVCAIIGMATDSGEIEIVGVGIQKSTGVRKGVIVDIDATTKAIGLAMGSAMQQANCDIEQVYVGVTGEHILSVNSSARIAISHVDRLIHSADVERVKEASRVIVLPPDRQIVHALTRGFSVDGQANIQNPAGMHASRLEVDTHIVHGSTPFLQNVDRCVTSAGLAVAAHVLEPIATASAVLLPAEKQLGVCIVDIGGGTSDIAVYRDGCIYFSSVLPIGGTHVTNDLAYGLAVEPEEAERLKTESGSALECLVPEQEVVQVAQLGRDDSRGLRRRALAHIIEPRMLELFELVQQELEAAECTGIIPAGVVISGGGSLLSGCLEAATQVLGVPVRRGVPIGIASLPETLQSPCYATAIGLVQFGVNEQKALPGLHNTGTGWLATLKEWLHKLLAPFTQN